MRKALMITVIVLSGCALLWLAGSAFVSSVTTTSVQEQWPDGLGTIDSVPGRFPPAETNAAARALIPIAARLSVAISPDLRRPQTDALSDQIASYVAGEISREDDGVQPPPAALGAFIAAHESDFAQLDNVVQHSPVVWTTNIGAARNAPLPNLLGYLKLNRLLVARALVRHGDPAAWSDLQTSWLLGRSLMQRPEIISALVGMGIARSTNAAARFLPVPAPQWREEMARFDYRRALVASQQAYAWSLTTGKGAFAVDAGNRRAPGVFHEAVTFMMMPLFDYAAAGLAKATRESAGKYAAMTQCGVDGEAFGRRIRDQIPRWNLVARQANANLGPAWQRAQRFRAELEGTSRILELRTLGWPASLPRIEQSQCSDGHWIYDGHSLRFSKELPVPQPARAMPLRFTSVRTPPASDLVAKPRLRLVRAVQPSMRIAG
jgi:hypothetical protein